MILLGLFLFGFGTFTLLQARLPREKRKIYPERSKAWMAKENRKPLGKHTCIGFGGAFAIAGLFLSLRALRIIEFGDVYLLLGAIPLFVIMIVGVIWEGIKGER